MGTDSIGPAKTRQEMADGYEQRLSNQLVIINGMQAKLEAIKKLLNSKHLTEREVQVISIIQNGVASK